MQRIPEINLLNQVKKPPPPFIEMWTLDIPLTALKNQLLFARSLPNINGFTIVPDPWAYSECKVSAFGMFLQTLVEIIANRRPVGQFQEHPVPVHQGAVQTGDYTLHSIFICVKRLKRIIYTIRPALPAGKDRTGRDRTGQDNRVKKPEVSTRNVRSVKKHCILMVTCPHHLLPSPQ